MAQEQGTSMRVGSPPTEGVLTRTTNGVYRHMALALWLIVLCTPSVAIVMMLAPVASNAMLFVWAQLPVAPALAAGLYSVRRWRQEGDGSPFALFATGLRVNALDVLRWWVPALAVGSILAFNIYSGWAVDALGAAARPVSIVLAVVLILVCGHALVLTSAFTFRTRDVARIAVHLLAAQWRTTLALVSLLIVAGAVTYLGSEAVLVLSAWAFVSVLELISRPTLTAIKVRFTASVG